MTEQTPWYALGAMFLGFTVVFAYPVLHYEILIPAPLTSDAAFIVLNIRYYTFLLLETISVMATCICIICGMLGKKNDRTE